MKIYPAEFTLVFLYFLFATIISAPVCLIAERNLSAFRLRPNIAPAAIVYSVRYVAYKRIIWLLIMSNFHSLIYQGIGLSLSTVVHTWGLHLKGPVHVSIFKPLSIAINCSCYECHIPWWCSLSWEVYNSLSLKQVNVHACMKDTNTLHFTPLEH